MTVLEYHPINIRCSSPREIRLLTLLNGEWNDKIKCRLDNVSLNDMPEYEALSYVWGSSIDLVNIDVDGATFPATRNLYLALRRLRDQIKSNKGNADSRILWVDAVCINQKDAVEKRQQVQLMGDIYSQATRGLLWLGEEPDRPQSVINQEQEDEVASLLEASGDLLEESLASLPHSKISEQLSPMPKVSPRPGIEDFRISRTRPEHWDPNFDPTKLDEAGKLALEADSFYQVACLLMTLNLGSHLHYIAHLQYEPEDGPATFRTNTRQALHWLGTRSWWSRIWTVQECVLPRDSELLYGAVRLPWGRFLTAISNFQKHRTNCCAHVPGVNDMLNDLVDTVLPCDTLYRYCHRKDVVLPKISSDLNDPSHVLSLFRPESLLWTFWHRDATDPRDKIYGILSLIGGPSEITGQAAKALIIPDYNSEMNYEKSYIRAVLAIIESSASLDIISQLGVSLRSLDLKLPSWVPDFSQPTRFVGSLDRYLKQLPCYNACDSASASISTIEGNILVLEGCLVDTIASTSCSMFYKAEDSQRSAVKKWYTFARDSYQDLAEKGTMSFRAPWNERFWRTLCGDTVMTGQKVVLQEDFKAPFRRISTKPGASAERDEAAYNLWCNAQGLDELSTGFPSVTSNDADDAAHEPAVGNIGHAIKISTATRKLFLSTEGHLGLCPPIAGLTYPQKDLIFVFPGGKTPFALRYVGMRHLPGRGIQPCHQLLGDCYLDMFMDGEAMKNFEAKKQIIFIV